MPIYDNLVLHELNNGMVNIDILISNTFLILFLNQMSAVRADIHHLCVRIANRTDPDQIAFSEAVCS